MLSGLFKPKPKSFKRARESRIAIIGAGPAGISTAHFLRRNGYPNVLVLEKLGRVGGLCSTITEDYRCYDLGANYVTPAYRETLRLAREMGLELYSEKPYDAVEVPADPMAPVTYRAIVDGVRGDMGFWPFLYKAIRYAFLRFRLRHIVDRTDFAEIEKHPELCVTFQQWLNDNGIGELKSLFEIPITMMGYGYVDEIAAPYALRYMSLGTYVSMILKGLPGVGWFIPWPRRFVLGFQRLWESLAWHLNVRLNVKINSIRRGDGRVIIDFTQQQQILNEIRETRRVLEFDCLVLACPLTLDVLAPFLDLSDMERLLFEKVLTNSYCMTTVHVRNLRMPISFACVRPLTKIGTPWGVSMLFPETGLVQCYSRVVPEGEGAMTDDEVQAECRTLLKRLGAEIVDDNEEWRTYDRWPYFQHVKPEDICSGFYSRLAELQGKQNTYYVGGVTNFELIEPIVQFAKSLVNREFPSNGKKQQQFVPTARLSRRCRPPEYRYAGNQPTGDIKMAAGSIPEVNAWLQNMIADSKSRPSRLGFFAALYEVMTAEIMATMTAGGFDDGPRMERMIVVFANRYIQAVENHRAGTMPSRCWHVAFECAENDRLLILQHLLLGMNAHINFDLGIAVAEVSPDEEAMRRFENDFNRVNEIMGRLLDSVQGRLARVSPSLRLLDELGGRSDEAIAGFSLQKARARAWQTAHLLHFLGNGPAAQPYLAAHDAMVAGFGQALINPLLSVAFEPIRSRESNRIPDIIDAIREG